jgi:hypothetical protein
LKKYRIYGLFWHLTVFNTSEFSYVPAQVTMYTNLKFNDINIS